ncbi:MAG: hypothetical protein IKY17_00455 [Oscillospiraceae bacterium]|nr:hypothetical protein [Oscillospiraceae bacterium]
MIDFHSHILPGVDDGSSSLEMSLQMLRMEAEQGIDAVVATPHFYARYESPDGFLKKRDEAEQLLRRAMVEETGLPRLHVGAEVYYFRGISESEFLPQMTIRGTNCVMIEMPPAPWTESMYRELAKIRDRRGLIPIVAHIDRYIAPFRTFRIPEYLEQLPVLVQANAGFFLNRATAGQAVRLLKKDRIHLLGSDCHDLKDRKPNLGGAVQRIRQKLSPQAVEKLSKYESIVFD